MNNLLFCLFFSYICTQEMDLKVTIGIPVYKAEDFIQVTLESALSQSYPNIEYLVLDDCGEDNSMSIVKQIQTTHSRGKDIRILQNRSNRGVGVSRNRLLDEARGQYFYFLDSDDIMEPDTIERMVKAVYEYKVEVVYGSWERIDNVNHTPNQKHVYPLSFLFEPDELAMYAFKNYSTFWVSACNCLMDITFLRSAKLRFLDTVFWEDLAFTYEMVTKVSRAVLLPDITYHYLCRPGSLSHYTDRDCLHKDEILRNVQTIDYLKEKVYELRGKKYLSYLCYNLEVASFYNICYVLKHFSRIEPAVNNSELLKFLRYPLPLSDISCIKGRWIENLMFFILSKLPERLFIRIIRLLGKLKGVI